MDIKATIQKATLRIPTKHQYAYIEIEVTGTPEDILQTYCILSLGYAQTQKKFDKDNEVPF